MKCNNKHCYWNMNGSICVSESLDPTTEHKFQPNQLDCTMSLRKDFEQLFWDLYYYLEYLGVNRGLLDGFNFQKMYNLYLIVKNDM